MVLKIILDIILQ